MGRRANHNNPKRISFEWTWIKAKNSVLHQILNIKNQFLLHDATQTPSFNGFRPNDVDTAHGIGTQEENGYHSSQCYGKLKSIRPYDGFKTSNCSVERAYPTNDGSYVVNIDTSGFETKLIN